MSPSCCVFDLPARAMFTNNSMERLFWLEAARDSRGRYYAFLICKNFQIMLFSFQDYLISYAVIFTHFTRIRISKSTACTLGTAQGTAFCTRGTRRKSSNFFFCGISSRIPVQMYVALRPAASIAFLTSIFLGYI